MKKRLWGVLTVLFVSVMLAACGSSNESAAYDYAATDSAAPEEYYYEGAAAQSAAGEMKSYSSEDYDAAEAETTTQGNADLSNRKLIKTVNLDVETQNYDELLSSLEAQISELGGYIEYLDCYGSHGRSASITARIPAEKLNGFVRQIGETANVIGRSESVEDVTLQYVDLDSHARMLEEEQERLLELLENANTIEDMITIEARLGEIKYQLESMKSQLRVFDNRVEYSTVHINIDEVIELTPVQELTDGERIVQGFNKSVAEVTDGIKEFFIGLIINIPYIIVWAVVIAVILLIVLAVLKLSDKRSRKLAEERQKKIASGEYSGLYVSRPASSSKEENGPTEGNKNTD